MADHQRSITLTDDNFETEVLRRKELMLIGFWADWCGPCHMIAPVIEAVAATHAGQLVVGKLNVDECPHTAQRFQIRALPTLLFFKGGHVVDRIIGVVPQGDIIAKLHALRHADAGGAERP
jgi:thioredoxin 1